MIHSKTMGHDDRGSLVPITDFDYDELEKNLEEDLQDVEWEKFTPEDVDRAMELFAFLVRWLWQNGGKNPNGLQIRSAIVCWIFLRENRHMTMTELASGFGMDKQSIGRWFDIFKKTFPFIKTSHMRSE